MKSFAKIALVSAGCLSVLLSAGCGRVYGVYTNIPQADYELGGGVSLGGAIDGYVPPQTQAEEIDVSAYTSRGWRGFFMMADADIVVSADFTTEDAVSDFDAFTSQVQQKLRDISAAISTDVQSSDIYKFNELAAGETLQISQIAYEVLSEAKHVYELTDGAYNPALYYNVSAYGFGAAHDYPQSSAELPADEVIEKYTDLSKRFGEVELTQENGNYFVTKPDYTVQVEGETLALKLDLGGIGKGYAVDEVDKLFDSFGYKFGYFNFGASSMLVKRHTVQGAYRLGFANPRSPSREPYIYTHLFNEKLSTSGDNEQYYILDGTRYCHIIDPETGKPVQKGIMSATVIGGSAASADALTTAITCMGRERATQFVQEKLTDRKVIFICE